MVADEVCKVCGVELTPFQPPPIAAPVYRPDPDRDKPPSFTIDSIGPLDGPTSALSPTLSLFFKNFWLITKLTVVIVAPFEIFKVLSLREFAPEDAWQLTVGIYAMDILCSLLIAPALIYAMLKIMQTGVAPGVNESYRWGFSKLGTLSIAAFLAWLLQVLGSLLCVIPGIMIGMALYLVYPIAVLEKKSVSQVLSTSNSRTKGYRWNIFGASFLLALMIGVISVPATGALAFFGVIQGPLWPLQVVAEIFVDIFEQSTTILSLVIYLSILRTLESRDSVIQ